MKKIIFSLIFVVTSCASISYTPYREEMRTEVVPNVTPIKSQNEKIKIDSRLVAEKIRTAKPDSILTPGKDAQKLHSEIEKIKNIKKDEFETTSDFEKRIQRKLDKLNSKSIIIQANIETKYDADSGVMKVLFKDDNNGPCSYYSKPQSTSPDNNRIEILYNVSKTCYECTKKYYCSDKNVLEVKDEYIAQNGFGAEIKVTKLTREYYGYMLNIITPKEFSIKIQPNKARLLKNNIKIITIGKIEKIGGFYRFERGKPSFNSPTEAIFSMHYVPIDVESVCLWDNKNKKCIEDVAFYKSF